MPFKVLVTTSGGTGHIHPMVPLAQALVGRGHDVLWALPDRSVAQVEQAGLRAVGVTSMPPVHPLEVLQQFPELRELTPPERPEHMFAKLFGALMAPPMLAGLMPVAQNWRPHLVVSDAAELAGPLVAAKLGLPCVANGFGPLLPEPGWRERRKRSRRCGSQAIWNRVRTAACTTTSTSTPTRLACRSRQPSTCRTVSRCDPSATPVGRTVLSLFRCPRRGRTDRLST